MRLERYQDRRNVASRSARAEDLHEFRALVTRSFVPLNVSCDHPSPFRARLRSAEGDDVIFNEVTAKPHLVERTAATIAAGGNGYYKVSLLLSGSSILIQDGRELVMHPGDLSVYDTSRPYSLLFGEEFRNLIMMFPKDRIALPRTFTEQLTAAPLTRQHPALASVISAMLAQFPEQLLGLDDHLRTKLARTSVDLVTTLFSSILDSETEPSDPNHALLRRICAHIDANLHSPSLSPGSIAAANFISTRHLHGLFRRADTTCSTWIRERRLERCREDLLDPSLGNRTITAIATRWGFTDAAHFSRVFKAAYGTSPSEFRFGSSAGAGER